MSLEENSLYSCKLAQGRGLPNFTTVEEFSEHFHKKAPERKISEAISLINQHNKVIALKERLRKKLLDKHPPPQ